MIKEIKKTQEIVTHERYCDVCGRLISYSHCKCVYCDKDVCVHCQADIGINDDYADAYCQSCWDKGEKYRNEINKMEELIEKLYRQWGADCREDK